jgi:hypothetical protein
MKASEVITLGIALVGAVLGIINTWQGYDRDRVKLRVALKVAYLFGPHGVSREPQLAIEVVNRSPFPLTISQLGLEQKDSKSTLALVDPITVDNTKLPRRLESRSAFTAYFSVAATDKAILHNLSRAYAKTDSGEIAYSSRKLTKRIHAQLQGRKDQQP